MTLLSKTTAAAFFASSVAAALAQAPPAPLYHVLKGTSHLKGPCYQQDYIDLDFRRKGYVDGACPKRFNKVLSTGHETVCTGQSDENIKYCQGKTTTYNTTEFGIQAFADETEKVGAGDSTTPCCKTCEAPLIKMYSVDHGPFHTPFCGEACMDPAKFNTYKIFEKNLTEAKGVPHPCANQFTQDGGHYTKYTKTVTHGVPGLLSVTLDLYSEPAPPAPPAPPALYHVLKGTSHLKGPCYQQDYIDLDFRRKGYLNGACPKRFNKVLSTGHETVCMGQSDENIKYCQGKTTTYNTTEFGIQAFADETEKVGAGDSTTPCCKTCEAPLIKMYSVDHGPFHTPFCGEACMDPAKFNTYKIFEKNLTEAKGVPHPCANQFTQDGGHYTEYTKTVTHGVPGLLSVTLDLYSEPKN